jgi:hypothetical protein
VTARDPGLTGGQIGALEMLAGCPDGCTEATEGQQLYGRVARRMDPRRTCDRDSRGS